LPNKHVETALIGNQRIRNYKTTTYKGKKMEATAKLIKIEAAQEGTSAKGPWRKAIAVFETEEQYPKTLAVSFFNSNLEEASKIPLGTTCKVKFDIKSREFNGKWYTDLNGFGIEAEGAQAAPPQHDFDKPLPPINQPTQEEETDLPFD
jgi:hypothetical protein